MCTIERQPSYTTLSPPRVRQVNKKRPVAITGARSSGAPPGWLFDLWALFAEARHTMGTTARTKTLNFSQPHVLRNEREYDAAVAWADKLTMICRTWKQEV